MVRKKTAKFPRRASQRRMTELEINLVVAALIPIHSRLKTAHVAVNDIRVDPLAVQRDTLAPDRILKVGFRVARRSAEHRFDLSPNECAAAS
jgi:hypothetical protein